MAAQRRSASKRPSTASVPPPAVSNAPPDDRLDVPPASRRRGTPSTPPDLSITDADQTNDSTLVLGGQSMPPTGSARARSPSVPADAISPPKRHVRIIALTPPRGCSTDDLRDHFDVVVGQLKGTIEQLGNAQEASVRRADLHDKQVKLLRQQFSNELLGSVKSERGTTNADFLQLRSELSAFGAALTAHSERVDASAAHLVAVDAQIQTHVTGAFAIIENEFAALKAHTAQATTGNGGNVLQAAAQAAAHATTSSQVNHLNDRMTAVEHELTKAIGHAPCEGGHCSHVTHLLGEMQSVQRAIAELRARGAGPVGPGGPGGLGKGMSAGNQPCNHCPHVTQLLTRVHDLEQQIAAAGPAQASPQAAPSMSPHAAPFLGPDGFVNHAPPGVGAPQYGQGMPQHHQWDHGQGASPVRWERLFDDKISLSPMYAYSGGGGNSNGGEKWRKTTRGYFMSKYQAAKQILDWVESMEETSLNDDAIDGIIHHAKFTEQRFIDIEASDLKNLGVQIWGFLNNCITGEARAQFEAADELNGLDAWRRVSKDIRKNRWIRRERLRQLIKNMPPISKLEDVERCILTFDNHVKAYEDVSGEKVNNRDKRSDLLNALPLEIREPLQWRLGVEETYEAFRDFIILNANNMLYQRGKMPGLVAAVAADRAADTPGPGAPSPDEWPAADDEYYDQLAAAIYRKGKGKGKGKGKDGKGKSGDAPGGSKCINCGSTAHATQSCPKPPVPRDQRPCWKCCKPGHIGSECPNAARAPVKVVDDKGGGGDPDYIGCVQASPWQRPTKTAKARPMPSQPTVWDAVQTSNSFNAIRDAEAAELSHRSARPSANAGGTAGDIVKRKKSSQMNGNEPKSTSSSSSSKTVRFF